MDSIHLCECGCGKPTPIAKRSHTCKQMVKGQPLRFLPSHHPRSNITPEQRFWAKVDTSGEPDACWIWKASRNHFGYGTFAGPHFSTHMAHRIAYELKHGPVPDGLFVLHRCDNPPCCNPAHLFLGTKKDNTHDAIKKGRFSRGEHHSTRLSEADVLAIRAEYASGHTSQAELARRYGAGPSLIWQIVHRKCWMHV